MSVPKPYDFITQTHSLPKLNPSKIFDLEADSPFWIPRPEFSRYEMFASSCGRSYVLGSGKEQTMYDSVSLDDSPAGELLSGFRGISGSYGFNCVLGVKFPFDKPAILPWRDVLPRHHNLRELHAVVSSYSMIVLYNFTGTISFKKNTSERVMFEEDIDQTVKYIRLSTAASRNWEMRFQGRAFAGKRAMMFFFYRLDGLDPVTNHLERSGLLDPLPRVDSDPLLRNRLCYNLDAYSILAKQMMKEEEEAIANYREEKQRAERSFDTKFQWSTSGTSPASASSTRIVFR